MPKVPSSKPSHRRSPVSAAVAVEIADAKLREAVMRALLAVDAVHDDGDLPTISLKSNSRRKSATLACYLLKGTSSLAIEINPKSKGTSFNVLEEIAHFLDHQVLGSGGVGFASKDAPELDAWRKAALGSSPVKALARHAKGNGKINKYLRAAGAPHEIFARSYSQYIAVKSEDPVLAAGLEKDRAAPFGDILHWNDEQFECILEAFDQLFVTKKWR
jgi:hypothetical protein